MMIMADDVGKLVARLGARHRARQNAADAVRAELRDAVIKAVGSGALNESQVTRAAGVDRMTVRRWLGKKPSPRKKKNI